MDAAELKGTELEIPIPYIRMAVDYNLYYNSEMDGEFLIDEAMKALNLEFEKKNDLVMPQFSLPSIGLYVYVLNDYEKKCKVKSNDFLFGKSITFGQYKKIEDDSVRREALLKIALYLGGKYINELVLLCNGESILLLQPYQDTLKVNTEDDFFSHGVAEVLNEISYQSQSYTEADFEPYR